MKTDARVRYTRMRIREAFFRCLREKPVNKITVKELCELAEINRATFYTHYLDPFDLLEKLEEETLQGIESFISKRTQGRESMLLSLLNALDGEQNPAALLASPNGDPGFGAKITGMFRTAFIPSVAELLPDATPEQQNAAYLFLAGGCGSFVSKWLEQGRRASPEKLAGEIEALCAAFVKAYGQQIQSA